MRLILNMVLHSSERKPNIEHAHFTADILNGVSSTLGYRLVAKRLSCKDGI